MSKKSFTIKVVFPIIGVIVFSTIPTYFIQKSLPSGFIYSVIAVVSSVIVSVISMFYIGLDRNWRIKIRHYIISKTHKLISRIIMRIMIFGGTGAMGNHLVALFRDTDNDIVVTTRMNRKIV